MARKSPKQRLIGLVEGVTLSCLGCLAWWVSVSSSLLDSLLAMVGLVLVTMGMLVLGRSGAFRYLLVLAGTVYFVWSLWTLLSGSDSYDRMVTAKIGLWFGPMCIAIGVFLFFSGRTASIIERYAHSRRR